jgi:hypothetical protein
MKQNMPDIEAPEVEYGANGGLAYKHVPSSGEASPLRHSDIDELRMRIITLENRLAATHNASTVATKTLKAVYRPDSHAMVYVFSLIYSFKLRFK